MFLLPSPKLNIKCPNCGTIITLENNDLETVTGMGYIVHKDCPKCKNLIRTYI